MRQFSRSSSTRRILMSFIDSPASVEVPPPRSPPPIIANPGAKKRGSSPLPGILFARRPHDLVDLLLQLEELVLHPELAVVEQRVAALEVLQADLRQLEVRLLAAVEEDLEHHELRLPPRLRVRLHHAQDVAEHRRRVVELEFQLGILLAQ